MKAFIILYTALSFVAQNYASDYITNPTQTDGFGSQFQSIIAAALYADLSGKQFVYTPFTAMEHNYNNDPTFLAQKEEFINFIDNFEVNMGQYSAAKNIQYKPVIDTYPALCAQSSMLKKIKTIFRANKDTHNYFKNDRFNVVIHVRRHNQQDNRIEGTNTPDALFLSVIDQLRLKYKNQKPLFHLHSQGTKEDFDVYQADDVILHLNESVEDSFLAMVLADVLVISPSSFSYTAALLSDGVVYYVPFWHSPLPHWMSVYDLLNSTESEHRVHLLN